MKKGILVICSFNQHVLSICSLAICSHDSGWDEPEIICIWRQKEAECRTQGKICLLRVVAGGGGGGKVREMGGEPGNSESVKYFIIIMAL